MANDAEHISEQVNAHYGKQDYGARILEALRATGTDLQTVTADDIVQATHFMRGKGPVLEIARMADLQRGMRVLDIGSGLGGPARTLATDIGCQVIGLELTDEFYRAAVMLTELTRLSDQVQFVHGNALEMPFPDEHFDAVVMTLVGMHVKDKPRLFRQVYRVLRPGGRFAFQDFAAGPVTPVLYPVGFAYDPSIAFLWPPEELETAILDVGFEEQVWSDQTPAILEMPPAVSAPPGIMPSAPQLLHGANLASNTQSMRRNFEERRLRQFRGVFKRP